MLKTIYLGADHAGFNLKNSLKEHLELQGHIVHDLGAHHLDPHDDYPPIAAEVAATVREHPSALGILVCGSAEGVAIAANKIMIARSIEQVYGVKPVKVNIIRLKGKIVSSRRLRGKRKDWKKAIITLPAGKNINIYEGV